MTALTIDNERKGRARIVIENQRRLIVLGGCRGFVAALEALGIDRAALACGSRFDSLEATDDRGRLLASYRVGEIARKFESMNLCMNRGDLLRLLAERVDPRCVRPNARCVSFREENGGVTVTLADGETLAADLLIGADGLHSVVRAALHGSKRPRYAGYTCHRGLADLSLDDLNGRAVEAWGRGARFAYMPCGEKIFWYSAWNAPENGIDGESGRRAEALKIFGKWSAPIPEIIAATRDDAIFRNDIVDRPPIRRWGRGRVTLLGDAAHPTTPNLGQGAAMALEDAVVLGRAIVREADPLTALRSYERARISRTARIVNRSWRVGKIGQAENRMFASLRNFLAATSLSKVALERTFEETFAFDPK